MVFVIHGLEPHAVGRGIRLEVLLRGQRRVRVNIDPQRLACAEARRGNGEDAGPRADIQDARAQQVQRLQRREAESGGRVVPGAEAHGGGDDDRDGVGGRLRAIWGLRTETSSAGVHEPRRSDRDAADRNWRQVLLRASRPVLVVHLAGGHDRARQSPRDRRTCLVASRRRGEEDGHPVSEIFGR